MDGQVVAEATLMCKLSAQSSRAAREPALEPQRSDAAYRCRSIPPRSSTSRRDFARRRNRSLLHHWRPA